MLPIRQHGKIAIVALVAAAAALLFVFWPRADDPEAPIERHPLALMTSLPIYWPEGADIASIVGGAGEQPWVRTVIERRYELVPLDSLSAAADGESGPLNGFDRLLLAQPRGLSPADNEALDSWVRGGGRLLYLLDPMLTGQYSVPVGDPRHPTLVGLVPPVILRWGLAMQYLDQQPFDLHEASYGDGLLPVQLAGDILILDEADGFNEEQLAARGSCEVLGEGLAARCKVGKGQVLVVADAAVLEMFEPTGETQQQLLDLLDVAFEVSD